MVYLNKKVVKLIFLKNANGSNNKILWGKEGVAYIG